MRKKCLFLFVLFLVVTFLFPVFSPSLIAKPINDNPDDDITNDGPWEDPSNRPDFFLGNTQEFEIQNVFINGKPLNPSIYFFTIHKELFVPVRTVTYALGGEVYWEPAKRKVYINGKELNTTRIILGPNCYVSLRSIAAVFSADVAYDTKYNSAAIWSRDPAILGYPGNRFDLITGPLKQLDIQMRLSGIEEEEKAETPVPPAGPVPTPPVPVPTVPEVPPPATPQVGPAPPGATPPPSSPTPGGADPFNFGF